eukprot:11217-Chlamydomonas_euryale.AAC.3
MGGAVGDWGCRSGEQWTGVVMLVGWWGGASSARAARGSRNFIWLCYSFHAVQSLRDEGLREKGFGKTERYPGLGRVEVGLTLNSKDWGGGGNKDWDRLRQDGQMVMGTHTLDVCKRVDWGRGTTKRARHVHGH